MGRFTSWYGKLPYWIFLFWTSDKQRHLASNWTLLVIFKAARVDQSSSDETHISIFSKEVSSTQKLPFKVNSVCLKVKLRRIFWLQPWWFNHLSSSTNLYQQLQLSLYYLIRPSSVILTIMWQSFLCNKIFESYKWIFNKFQYYITLLGILTYSNFNYIDNRMD